MEITIHIKTEEESYHGFETSVDDAIAFLGSIERMLKNDEAKKLLVTEEF